MFLGLSDAHWMMILWVLVVPMLVFGVVNFFFQRRGGIGRGWGGVLFAFLAGVFALLVILNKIGVF